MGRVDSMGSLGFRVSPGRNVEHRVVSGVGNGTKGMDGSIVCAMSLFMDVEMRLWHVSRMNRCKLGDVPRMSVLQASRRGPSLLISLCC